MTEAGITLDDWQIRLLLPHRPPVLQLDRVDWCPPALGALEASKALGANDPMIQRAAGAASFLAPSALIEALAQCCGLLLRLRWLANDGVDLDAFAAGDTSQVDQRVIPRSALAESHARFASPVSAGQILRLATRLTLSRGDMHRFDASVHAGAKAVSMQIMLNFPTPDEMWR